MLVYTHQLGFVSKWLDNLLMDALRPDARSWADTFKRPFASTSKVVTSSA
jgi:hypothetical protein